MTFDQMMARNYAMDHYLDDPAVQARFLERLRAALCDPAYIIRRRGFDWSRFASEFSAPDFDPPLEKWELFSAIRQHFAPPGQYDVPRNRVWWAVRIVVGVEDPLQWLLDQKAAGRRWTEVARQLGCGVTNQDISRYL